MGRNNSLLDLIIGMLVLALVGILFFAFFLKPRLASQEPSSVGQPSTQQSISATLPTMTPMSGWKKFEGIDVELWLPEYFIGGNPKLDPNVSPAAFRTMGFGKLADGIERIDQPVIFVAFDAHSIKSKFLTAVTVHDAPSSAADDNIDQSWLMALKCAE